MSGKKRHWALNNYGSRCGQLVDAQHEAWIIEKIGHEKYFELYGKCGRCVNLLEKDKASNG